MYHLVCLHILAIVNNAAMPTCMQISLWALLLILLGIYSEVELIDNMVIVFLIFWGTDILFSIVAALFDISTNCVQAFQFLHILVNTCYFLVCLFVCLFVFMFIYFWGRETEREWRRGRERGRYRIWSRLQVLSCQHRTQREAWTCKLQDHNLSWSWTPNRLNHPGVTVTGY